MTAHSLPDDAISLEGKNSPLQRSLLLLKLLADHTDTGLRVPEICKHLGVHRVSAHRMLNALSDIGYVEQAPDLSYHLGFEALFLGVAAAKHLTPNAISEAMTRIAEETGESVFVMRRVGLDGCLIACQEGRVPIRFVKMRVGMKRTMGVGALSVAILSAIDAAEADKIILQNEARYREANLTLQMVREFVALARTRGYSYSEGLIIPETRNLAVPIKVSTRKTSTTMSMSIITMDSHMREPRRTELADLLKREARRVEANEG